MPNNAKMNLPAAANTTTITKLTASALTAIARLARGPSAAVRLKNTGVLAMGFMMAKNPMKTEKA